MAERREWSRRPGLSAALAIGLFAALLAWLGTRTTYFALDETLYHASAVHYASDFPGGIFHDYTARATSRLYALMLAPLFAVLDGDVAIRAAKVLNTALWCSVAIPLWSMARDFLSPRRAAVAVTLSVVAPWAVISTALFTEALALASFVWFTWAAMLAVRSPAWWRDLLVLVLFVIAITARVQLAGIIVGYLLMIALRCRTGFGGGGAPWWWRAGSAWRTLRGGFPVTTVAVVVGAPAAAMFVLGLAGASPDQLLGDYLAPQQAQYQFRDVGPMFLIELLAIGVGVGIVALLAAASWYPQALAGRAAGRDYAVATLTITATLVLFTAVGQRGYWGALTEERYWMYGYVFIWPAALAASGRRLMSARSVLAVALVLVVCAATLGSPRTLDPETVFLAPVLAALGTLTAGGLGSLTDSSRDVITIFVVLLAGGSWAVLRSAPWLGQDRLVAAGAVVQLALTAYVLLAAAGQVAGGAAKRTGGDFAALGWLDRSGTGTVDWLDSEPRADVDALRVWQLTTPFWNDVVRGRVAVAGVVPTGDLNPLDALPLRVAQVGRSGLLSGVRAGERLVAFTDSPYVQLQGARTIATSKLFPQLRLVALPPAPRLALRTTGLGPGEVIPGPRPAPVARLTTWGVGSTSLTLTLTTADAPGRVVLAGVRAGRADVVLPAGSTVEKELTVCGPSAEIRLWASGVVRLASVAIKPAATAGCSVR